MHYVDPNGMDLLGFRDIFVVALMRNKDLLLALI